MPGLAGAPEAMVSRLALPVTELPAEVDSSNVDANYKNGILKLKLKKVKKAETKTIKIRTG